MAAEALGRAFDASAANYLEVETLSAYVERYLSPRHRDAPGSGCAIATLGCEVPRQGDAMRQTFTEGLRRLMERLTRLLGPNTRRKCENEALAIAAYTGRRHDPGSRRRRSGVIRSDTGSVPRAIKPDLRLASRRLKILHAEWAIADVSGPADANSRCRHAQASHAPRARKRRGRRSADGARIARLLVKSPQTLNS